MNIREEREKRELSRKQMAELLGVNHRTVESWEHGARNPSAQIIMLIENGVLDAKRSK